MSAVLNELSLKACSSCRSALCRSAERLSEASPRRCWVTSLSYTFLRQLIVIEKMLLL